MALSEVTGDESNALRGIVSIDHAANNGWRAQPAAARRPTHPVCCSLHCPPRGADARHDPRWQGLAHPPAATETATATEERHPRNATAHAPRARTSDPLLL